MTPPPVIASPAGKVTRKIRGKKAGEWKDVEVDMGQVMNLLRDTASPEVPYVPPTDTEKFWTRFRLIFAKPWARFKKGSVLTLKIGGSLSDKRQPSFGGGATESVPDVCLALRKAARDPRVSGLAIKIEPLSLGWAKIQEICAHLDHFRASGKPAVAYLEIAGEKEYYLAAACGKVYAPESAYLSLRGFSVSGSFLRGTLEKVGVEPEIKRIGKYKSAGDQLLRKDMSDPQREQLTAVLESVYGEFLTRIAARRGKTVDEVADLLERGVYETSTLLEEGWIDGLCYESDITDMIKEMNGTPQDEWEKKEARMVPFKKYVRVDPTVVQIGEGKQVVAVVRGAGAISGSASDGSNAGGDGIRSKQFLAELKRARKDPRVAAIVIRVDSPGGDALASDLMWAEIQKTRVLMPVVASMSDVAASGGYYMSMGCDAIVAQPLTLTGSIGVITGKFSFEHLYAKLGFVKEIISRGKYAESLVETRSFSVEEKELFDRQAEHAYQSFRNKAALSRGMEIEQMQERAQGRVWSGKDAFDQGLVDGLGGVDRAVRVARALAGIQESDKVAVREVSFGKKSPLELVTSGGASASASASVAGLASALMGGLVVGLSSEEEEDESEEVWGPGSAVGRVGTGTSSNQAMIQALAGVVEAAEREEGDGGTWANGASPVGIFAAVAGRVGLELLEEADAAGLWDGAENGGRGGVQARMSGLRGWQGSRVTRVTPAQAVLAEKMRLD